MLFVLHRVFVFFFFNDTATTEIYTLSLHDALPILCVANLSRQAQPVEVPLRQYDGRTPRSEEHTSELQSQFHLVCRLLLEKKKTIKPERVRTISQKLPS